MKPIPTNLKIPEEIEMRALLRDAQDQTRIALEVEEVVYDPKDNKLLSAVLLVMTLLSWILQQMKSRCHPFGWHLFYHL